VLTQTWQLPYALLGGADYGRNDCIDILIILKNKASDFSTSNVFSTKLKDAVAGYYVGN